jgi:Gpi18-like mannosyltransferase
MLESSNILLKRSKGLKYMYRLVPLYLVIACIVLLALTHIMQGTSPFTPSAFNTYTLQAMQWRNGEIALDHDYPYLELAIYQGKYYVSFPPVPSIPIYFLTFLFGFDVPDTLLIQIYAIAACLIVYRIFKDAFQSSSLSAVWAFLICFASSFLPLLQNGAVWYQAQVLAFLLTVAAIERMQKGKPTAGLLFFALSVGCRPFNALYGPLLIAYGMRGHLSNQPKKIAAARMLPGLLLGLSVAIAYAVYNYVRFGNIFEFGHNYLPEYSTQGGIQFALSHIPGNAPTFVWGLPFAQTENSLEIKSFGFSMFLANPILLCFFLWVFRDMAKRQLNCYKIIIFGTFIFHALLLLTHRTCGGFQYGARYFVDCIPYVLIYFTASKNSAKEKALAGITKTPFLEYGLLLGGLILSIYGTYYIHL